MRLVLFMFAGRQANMEVQKPYLDRILSDYPEAELHLWDLTRDPDDQAYVYGLEGAHAGRVRVQRHLHGGHPIRCLYPHGQKPRGRGHPRCVCIKHKPPYEEPYRWYVQHGTDDTIYVKMDDDVLFLETDRFSHLVDPLVAYPNRIISANVANNAVCSKYQPFTSLTANKFVAGDPLDPANDKRWWALHEDPEFASWSHAQFLNRFKSGANPDYMKPTYVRTRPGEAVSINCIAFTHATMKRIASMMSDRLGDEGAVDRCLPWICLSFHAAHLSFGPQEKRMHADVAEQIRDEYRTLSKEYLA